MNNLMVIDGIEVRRDAYGRYSLNDLHRAAVASGANARTKEPGKFLSSQQTVELVHELTNTQNLGVDPVSVIHGGNERGTYVCKELVYASLYIDLCNCLILICSIQHQMKVNLW
uniref:KilA-N domain-containing protein n=1 Tax=Escherichia coli TaxID=562 RepID=UPI00374DD7E4